jgi:hypothetical protein
VLAHAGYAVIPAYTAEKAIEVLQNRHVSAMVIGHSIALKDRQRLCSEGLKLGIPAVVLDKAVQSRDCTRELHIDPLEGPEMVLEAIATVLAKRGKA